MLDYVAIFTRGGVLLWDTCAREVDYTEIINKFIKTVLLEERRADTRTFEDEQVAIHYRFDNEWGTILIAAFQKAIKINYLDNLLASLQRSFRAKFDHKPKDVLALEYKFETEFKKVLKQVEQASSVSSNAPRPMRTFNESVKSKKTVSSLLRDNQDPKKLDKPSKAAATPAVTQSHSAPISPKLSQQSLPLLKSASCDQSMLTRRKKLIEKSGKQTKQPTKSPAEKAKQPRKWEYGGSPQEAVGLDRSKPATQDDVSSAKIETQLVGTMRGDIRHLEVSTDEELSEEEQSIPTPAKSSSGLLSYFKGFVGSRVLNADNLRPALEKMRDHLISKNVAADITVKLCDSVASSLDGKNIGTFDTVANLVKHALDESLTRILTPKRRIDIIRDALESKAHGRPYVITFCGVNGVGKSTNLAKICFWLNENKFNVLIAACDTFRAGAVEQLRTHMRMLNKLHPPDQHTQRPMVELYEKGYGKDAAGIAQEAIRYAKDEPFDIVLVDTAGRMQDNEPLMRSLSKLITINEPDLVLFVGEALVGNEAVDQLVKFNQALADYSSHTIGKPHTIDGIVLTKFDTIDDKVGAAISMTYATGQPIVFIGTGQTYSDLRAINVNVVVRSLMK